MLRSVSAVPMPNSDMSEAEAIRRHDAHLDELQKGPKATALGNLILAQRSLDWRRFWAVREPAERERHERQARKWEALIERLIVAVERERKTPRRLSWS